MISLQPYELKCPVQNRVLSFTDTEIMMFNSEEMSSVLGKLVHFDAGN